MVYQDAGMLTEPLLPPSQGHSQAPPMEVPVSESPSVLPFLPSPESAFCLPETCERPEYSKSLQTVTSSSKATRPRGVQTRLSFSRMTNLLRQVKNLTQKCQRLRKKQKKLQGELSALRQQAKETKVLMKKTNITILQVRTNLYLNILLEKFPLHAYVIFAGKGGG